MAVYDKNGNQLSDVYDRLGNPLSVAYDKNGNVVFTKSASRTAYMGGYIEIQPDSWDGNTPVTGDIVQPSDSTAWGFPMSLSEASKASIKAEIFGGNGYGVSFIRFPMGFAYRGYRNIDSATGLAKNIGQRWEGQNTELESWFSNISAVGGGLDFEYWCPAPYWLTGGAYYNPSVNNELWAGGSYSRTTTLESIKASDPTQYANQIDAFTDAVVNDMEYVHQNVSPIRMYSLAGEPTGTGKSKYGRCHWTSNVYNDVLEALHPKVMASSILSEYDGEDNIVNLHLCADDQNFEIGMPTINNHPEWLWGYSSDLIRRLNGEAGEGYGADFLKSEEWIAIRRENWKNIFTCEYEYFYAESIVPNDVRFSNNVVRMIFEMCLGKAKIIMPIIHVCKPTGQSSVQTNTVGYCMYAVDMADGSYTVNPWAYNSWKMFNDNLPIGAELIEGGDGGLSKAGYVEFEKDGKKIILLGNYSASAQSITLTFDSSKTFSGKLYSLTNLGTARSDVSGSSITFSIPAYSGLVYIEN